MPLPLPAATAHQRAWVAPAHRLAAVNSACCRQETLQKSLAPLQKNRRDLDQALQEIGVLTNEVQEGIAM